MIYDKTVFTLKDGKSYTFRTPELSDAKQCLDFINRVARQTPYLGRCEFDDYGTVDKECEWVEGHRNSSDSYLIAVYAGRKQIASADIKFDTLYKQKHVGHVGIVIDYCYWDKGIGSKIFSEFFRLSKERGIELLTLWMVDDNYRARYLYKKFGFKQFGLLPNGHKYKGTYEDLAFMVAPVV